MVWRPQPGPQKALIDCTVPEVFYGGARGGGKTDGVLGKYALKAQTYGKGFNAVFFRKEIPMLDDAIERSHDIYSGLGAKWADQKKTWRFPRGGRLRFRPLERIADAEKYQGQNISDACVEEAGNYADPKPIDRLNGTLRSAYGVPTQLLLTGNPGGPGQQWLKARYVDPAPSGMKILRRELPNGAEHRYVFIPSRLQQNRILMTRDPGYINRLYMVGSAELVKAWLEGDWSAVEGAYFDCWSSAKHVIKPFAVPDWWARFRSFDWGSAAPFSVQWWAVSDGSELPDGRQYPAGAIICYREWYGASAPNVGLKMTAEEVAAGIVERERGEPKRAGDREVRIAGVADPSIFRVDGGPSIAERMFKAGARFGKADNRRTPRNGPISGWDQMRQRLIGDDGVPMIYCFDTCVDSIRTIPALQHDASNAEDVDTNGEDHAGDSWRYACMSRPYIRKAPPKPDDISRTPTLDELIAITEGARLEGKGPERI